MLYHVGIAKASIDVPIWYTDGEQLSGEHADD